MRFSNLFNCLAMWLVTATALAIPPREPVKSYKSYGNARPSAMDATPSFSPAAEFKRSKSPGMPMGGSSSSMTGRQRPGVMAPGSMLPGAADYYRSKGLEKNYQQNYQQNYGPNYQQRYGANYQQNVGANNQQNYRPNVVINRPQFNVNNTTIINQNITNRPGYGYGSSAWPHYSQLHYHWQPSTWSRQYLPAYYNYGYSSVGGSWLSVGGTSISYVNPFFVRPSSSVRIHFDYSRPIRVPDSSYRESRDDLINSERAIRRFDDAREIFRRGEYGRASELIDEAIDLFPSDPTLHQFRALVLFAREQYQEAASVLYSVLAVSPGWDANTITKLYDSPNRYLMQVNQLAQYAASYPESIDSQFLLAYHYAMKGDLAGAERQLLRVDAARPGDRVVESLLTALN